MSKIKIPREYCQHCGAHNFRFKLYTFLDDGNCWACGQEIGHDEGCQCTKDNTSNCDDCLEKKLNKEE